MSATVYILGILLQAMAGVIALLQVRHAPRKLPWFLIALSSLLIVARRVTALEEALAADRELASGEILTLVISLLFFLGVILMTRMFREVRDNQAELQRSESALRLKNLVFDASIAANCIVDPNGVITDVNSAFLLAWGYHSREQVVGRPAHEIFDNPQEAAALMETLNRTGQWEGDRTAKKADGTPFLGHALATVVRDERGTLIGYQAAVIDITEHRRTEVALQESEEKYRTLVEKANEVILIAQDNAIAYANPLTATILGLSIDELIGRPFMEFIHPDDQSMVMNRYRMRIAGENVPDSYEFRIAGKDGKTRWVYLSARQIQWHGRPATLNMLTDISERKQTEQALVDSEKRYREIIENVLDVYYRSDETGTLTMLSPSGVKLLGYASETDALGISVANDMYANPVERNALLEKIRNEGQVRDYEVILKSKDGRPIPVSTSSRFCYGDDGSILGVEGFFRDISDRKRAEEELRKRQELEQSIFSSVPHGLFGVQHRSIFFVNDAMETVFGWKPEELVGQSTRMLFRSDEDWEAYGAMLYAMLAKERVVSFEPDIPFVRKDGREFYCRNSVSRIGEHLAEGNRIVATFEDITERRQTERELREAKERYQSFIAVSNTGAWEYHADTDYLWCSPEYFSMIGRDPSGFDMAGTANLKETWQDLLHPDDREQASRHFRDYLDGGSRGLYESYFRMAHADGSWVWIWSRGCTLRNEQGELTGKTVGTHIDITRQKQDEDALRQNEARFRSIFQTSPFGLCIMKNRVYQSANNAWYADFGYREAEIIGHTTRMLYESDEEYERVGHELYSKLHEREMATVQTRIKRKDGDIREVFVTAAPLQPEDLSAGIVVAVEDITERKLAEEGLRESQRQLADIISFLPDATFVIDRDGVVRAWNREIELMTGVKAEDMVGKGNFEYAIPFYGERRPIIVDIDPLQDREQSGSTMSDIQHEEAVLSGEVWVPQAFGGKGAYLWGRASLLHNAEGQVIGAVKSIRDITERKRAEETRRELEERLQRSEKMEALGLLAGGVAHDLNNVLGILVGYSELLAEDLDKASPLRAHVDYIRQGGERAAAIVQDLLTLARRGVQTREIVDLNAVIDEFRSSPDFEKLQSFYPRVTIETSLASGLMNVKGSPIHLRKTVMNLVSNAAEATPSGGLITIATRNEYLDRPLPGYAQVQEGDYVVLTVSDTGEGISVKDMRRIFEPFYTKKVMGRSGTGLGLSVVWGTVKDHNGYINVQSREGKGSTFTLYFPVTREEASREGIAVPVTAYMGDGESILVVDDVQGQRDLAVQMLKKLCYRVDSVASGEEALDYLKKSRADLLVLDMIMDPGMDGLDTYREILKLHPKQKVIIVSGFSESDRVRQAQALGAGTYVRKPYVLETLGLAVRKELGKTVSPSAKN